MEGKRNSFLATFSPHKHKKLQYTRTSNANCFKIFHHVDLPEYLMYAQDDRAEKCTRMPEARAELCTNNYTFCFLLITRERTKHGPLVHGPPLWTGSMDPPFFFFFLFVYFFFTKKVNHTKPNHSDWVHGHPIFASFKISCKEILLCCFLLTTRGGCNSGTKCLCFAGQNVFVDDWYNKGDRPAQLLHS